MENKYINGSIGDVQVSGNALTASEVDALMKSDRSKKLEEVVKGGFSNNINKLLPRLAVDYDLQKSIYGDIYNHYTKLMSDELIKEFDASIDSDYIYMISVKLRCATIPAVRELIMIKDSDSTKINWNAMLISVISSGFDGYVADLIAPKQLCSYDYTKGNVYDEMLTDLMPYATSTNCQDDSYVSRLNEAIEIDYNTGLNRKPVVAISLPMTGLHSLTNHIDTYGYLYRTVKHRLKTEHRLSEDKASRVANILACTANKNIYTYRDVISDILITVNLTDGIRVLYTLMKEM